VTTDEPKSRSDALVVVRLHIDVEPIPVRRDSLAPGSVSDVRLYLVNANVGDPVILTGERLVYGRVPVPGTWRMARLSFTVTHTYTEFAAHGYGYPGPELETEYDLDEEVSGPISFVVLPGTVCDLGKLTYVAPSRLVPVASGRSVTSLTTEYFARLPLLIASGDEDLWYEIEGESPAARQDRLDRTNAMLAQMGVEPLSLQSYDGLLTWDSDSGSSRDAIKERYPRSKWLDYEWIQANVE